jgi:hypothetical protein
LIDSATLITAFPISYQLPATRSPFGNLCTNVPSFEGPSRFSFGGISRQKKKEEFLCVLCVSVVKRLSYKLFAISYELNSSNLKRSAPPTSNVFPINYELSAICQAISAPTLYIGINRG